MTSQLKWVGGRKMAGPAISQDIGVTYVTSHYGQVCPILGRTTSVSGYISIRKSICGIMLRIVSDRRFARKQRIWQVLPTRNSNANKDLQNHMAGRLGSGLVEAGESASLIMPQVTTELSLTNRV